MHKALSTPQQLARLMKEATADSDLVLHHTDTAAFSVATKPDDRSIPPACARYPFTAGWTETMGVKCLVQGHNAMDRAGLELTTFRPRIQSLNSSATSNLVYIHTYIYTYINTYIHTYIHFQELYYPLHTNRPKDKNKT